MKLYLARGEDANDIETNLDWFVVAENVDDAIAQWNAALLDFREEPAEPGELMHIREILADVSGTRFDGPARFIPWEDLTIVHEAGK